MPDEDFDKIFKEEELHLENTEKQIDEVLLKYKDMYDFYAALHDKCSHNDYQGRDNFIALRKDLERVRPKAKEYESYKYEPYYGRIDVYRNNKDNKDIETYYIGKKSFSHKGKEIVLDWRAPVVGIYNSKQSTSEYTLNLRRELTIKDGKLVGYITTNDNSRESQNKDVTDEFLISILEERRKQNKPTDIIETIQMKQDEIIRAPFDKSFVVQGCAGSGKTMILLHRLSYLKFNHKDMKLDTVKIITPNTSFNAQIDELSEQLELNKIARLSVEEYYASLINQFTSRRTVNSSIKSEKSLNTSLMLELYSDEYTDKSIIHYHNYWNEVLMSIDEKRLRTIFEKFNLDYPDTTVHTTRTVEQLMHDINHVRETNKKNSQDLATLPERINNLTKEIEKTKQEDNSALEKIRKQATKYFEEEINKNDELKNKGKNRIENLTKEIKNLENNIIQVRNDIKDTEDEIEALQYKIDTYSDYDMFLLCDDELSASIRDNCKDIIKEIKLEKEKYLDIPDYNFSKRNKIKRQIDESKARFSSSVKSFFEVHKLELSKKFELRKNEIEKLTEKINIAKEEIGSEKEKQVSYSQKDENLFVCLEFFDSNPEKDDDKISPDIKREYKEIFDTYDKQKNECKNMPHKLNSSIQRKEHLKSEQSRLLKMRLTDEEIKYVSECAKVIDKLEFEQVIKNVMESDLIEQYKKYNQRYTKTNYRHKLYLRLLYCNLYFPKLRKLDTFLNIDEAQDISLVEYSLLYDIMGEKCIFNLYGDVNQCVYDYKGVSGWEEIDYITRGSVYVLNENYRNTVQITDYCNNKFGANIESIGIDGKKVNEMSMDRAIKWILDIKKENPDYRAAIIHRHGADTITEHLQSILKEDDVSWYQIDNEKISVITAEEAKGLEFEAVVVIPDQMSENEKYIALTRALKHLTAVNE